MTRLALADELAEIRAEIARLQKREETLATMAKNFPVIPVFRRGWPLSRDPQKGAAHV
ncbi:MAG: hypothetical protein U1E06_20735 [Tabrizicola sp.]|uniref:hypothetical protein n=1 Tax=Tabrizicola sp. TaxID=2005166 RepID=UPI0027356833|nr:hypothetical protein [Tabrizicola sp.]MDP3265161.1 hypothetical protein [Tabrizicola sp.]MDP3646929.1 hypothetical protein [Paracoccaceae bacterium]MDZ4069229.1 hypothetical protein [Tabrizicola sp.]